MNWGVTRLASHEGNSGSPDVGGGMGTERDSRQIGMVEGIGGGKEKILQLFGNQSKAFEFRMIKSGERVSDLIIVEIKDSVGKENLRRKLWSK